MTDIDKDWFSTKLAEINQSLRGLARHMELDPSAVSRMLDGKRRMKMEEANSIASFLGAPVDDVLRHAGVNLAAKEAPARIMITSTIDERGNVTAIAEPRPLPAAVLERAGIVQSATGGSPLLAAQVRAESGPLAIIDDAVMLYRRSMSVDPEAIGTLAICRNGNGGQIIGKLERARKTGEAQIIAINGKSQTFDLHIASRILAIVP